MKTYGNLVQERLRDDYCPFCSEGETNYIDSNNMAYVVPARAPYMTDHILICPKFHITSLIQCSPQELQDIRSLITKWNQILVDRHTDLVIFMREGSVLGTTGKTVGHLHRHIVPHLTIHYQGNQADSDAREFMSDEQYHNSISHLQSYLTNA